MDNTLVLTGTPSIRLFALITQKSALGLECKGLRRRGPSVAVDLKRKFGWKGNKKTLLAKLTKYIEDSQNPETSRVCVGCQGGGRRQLLPPEAPRSEWVVCEKCHGIGRTIIGEE